jgi:hypothetical protein
MNLIDRCRAAWAAFRKEPEPLNGGHRFAIQSTSDLYCWADAIRLDPMTGEPEWICDRGDHIELKKKLPSWGILVDLQPEITIEEFRQGKS